MTAHAPGPWEYRTLPHDDWGTVRASNGPIVALARGGTWDEIDADAHRAAGTDPYEANGRLIAAAPALLSTLRGCAAALKRGDVAWAEELAAAMIAKATGAP
jgi:hypothetical protein